MVAEYQTNQARRHAFHMYTDDLIALSLSFTASRNMVVEQIRQLRKDEQSLDKAYSSHNADAGSWCELLESRSR